MEITIFASGSSGNCSVVTDGKVNILIDAGISLRRIAAGLRTAGLAPEALDGVLVTHEHSDHISGLPMLLKHHPLPVYATRAAASRIAGMLPDTESFFRPITAGESFDIGGVEVTAFRTPHDSADSVGYRLDDGCVLGFATDTGCVTGEMLDGLMGADTAVIEANHDVEMLRYGRYPVYLKRRILSDVGHLSNENCGKLAKTLAENGTGRIIIGHLSKENNTPETARLAVEAELESFATELFVAPAAGYLAVPVGKRAACLA
jgi:phosphoribosyl 1,2-cyclic phosphodiesterase